MHTLKPKYYVANATLRRRGSLQANSFYEDIHNKKEVVLQVMSDDLKDNLFD